MSAAACKIIICSNRIAADVNETSRTWADLRSLETLAAMAPPPPADWLGSAVEILDADPGSASKAYESWALKLSAHLDELFSGA